MKHCTDELLEKYFDKRCGIIRNATVLVHLRECAECKLRLDALADDRKLISEIRDVLGGQAEIEKMEAEFRGLGRLRELLGDDDGRAGASSRH